MTIERARLLVRRGRELEVGELYPEVLKVTDDELISLAMQLDESKLSRGILDILNMGELKWMFMLPVIKVKVRDYVNQLRTN